MMKPEQQVLRTGFNIVIEFPHRREILTDGIAAPGAPVKADAGAVGAVVIDAGPVQPGRCRPRDPGHNGGRNT